MVEKEAVDKKVNPWYRMRMPKPLPKSIMDRFTVKVEKKIYILECKRCGQRFSLDHSKPITVGSTLTLLNHSIGHDVSREDDE